MQNYGINPYYQQRFTPLKIYSVSNILEANSTPVDNFDPIFFYNRAENVIYKKQIDGTGAAPIQIFKSEQTSNPDNETLEQKGINTYEENFKALNERIDGLYEILKGGKNESVTDADKPNNK